MNVYVPPSSRHSYNSTRKLPIMVFLHPGSYIQGSGIQNGLWNPDDVLLKRDVIFVTLNFRLNVFGCMLVPGGTPNLWLHDQRAAINFLKIIGPSFGGDPNEITLMGESSGATMVLAHIASPTSDANLIRRALVMSSPVALDAWTMERARDVSASIAKAANCDINDMRCLTTVSPLTLLIASASTLNFFFGTSRPFNFGLPWAPVTDGIHVLGDPLSVIMSRQHKLRIPLMMGTLRDEAHFLTSPIGYVSFFNVSDALNRYTVPKVLESAFGLQYRDKIMQQYKFVGNAEQQLDRAFEIITDALFTCSTRKLLAEYSKDVPETYFYHFEQNIELIFKSFGGEYFITWIFGQIFC
ncbi:Carboxylesterase [Paraphysoderma sedebokerense]|nr:Carboxylesterase [Paraphysoderma sedebokerense]